MYIISLFLTLNLSYSQVSIQKFVNNSTSIYYTSKPYNNIMPTYVILFYLYSFYLLPSFYIYIYIYIYICKQYGTIMVTVFSRKRCTCENGKTQVTNPIWATTKPTKYEKPICIQIVMEHG